LVIAERSIDGGSPAPNELATKPSELLIDLVLKAIDGERARVIRQR